MIFDCVSYIYFFFFEFACNPLNSVVIFGNKSMLLAFLTMLFLMCVHHPFLQIFNMYNNVGVQPAGNQPPFPPQASPFGNAFSGASSGLIRSGLSAYGEKIFGSSSEYVQSNVSISILAFHVSG